MSRKIIFVFIFIFFSTITTFAFDYWYLDVTIENYNFSGRPSIQRVYLFKDLRSFQEATGFPRGVGNDPSNTSFDWKSGINWRNSPNYNYFGVIYNTMRNEGFLYAFIMNGEGFSNVVQRHYWGYWLYMLNNNIEYSTTATRYDNPIRF